MCPMLDRARKKAWLELEAVRQAAVNRANSNQNSGADQMDEVFEMADLTRVSDATPDGLRRKAKDLREKWEDYDVHPWHIADLCERLASEIERNK